ncbi:MAG: CHAT domain-containing protein, partial [Candidatus Krumholzibacteria bacterium]
QLNIGYLYQKLRAFSRGLKSAAQARELAEKAEQVRLVRDADALSAELEWLSGRPEKSLEYWRRALERDRADGAKPLIARDEIGIANANALLGKRAEARDGFRNAYAKVRELGSKRLERVIHLGIAHTYQEENPDSAIHHYELGLEIIEKSRATLGGSEVRTGFLSGERRFLYEEVARYYASLDRGEDKGKWSGRAFVTVERAKARGLLDLLEHSILAQSSQAENAVLDSIYGLDDAEDAATKERLKKRYVKLRDKRLESSVGELATAGVAGIEDVQQALPKGTVLLEYALGDTSSLLWVVDRKGHSLHELPDRKTIRTQVERMREAIARPGAGDATLLKTARNLYELLVQPAEESLKKAKTVVIVPDGILFETPFEALLTRNPDENKSWKDQPFLARSFDTIYSPSASVFLRLEKAKKRGKYSEELLALGDPDYSHLATGSGTSKTLAPLPQTRAEVMSISSRLKDDQKKVLLGEEASEARLKEILRASRPRILHLATHGLINPLEPASSSIALCTSDGSSEDGYLHTLEILSLPLDVGLVVLSACETARGKVSRGEGVVGLSRAFIASGAGGVVASLWAVSDESTAQLMDKFYERMLGKKHPAGKALNEARLAMIKTDDFAHPFYWSPFIVIGTDRSPW